METNVNKLTTGNGMAYYTNANSEPSDWLVEAIPGAAAARAEWKAENAKAAEISAEISRSGRALLETRAARKRDEVTDAELAAAESAHRALYRKRNAQGPRAMAALRKFDAIVSGAATDPESVRRIAARYAAEKHEAAAAAWEVLREALAARDEAWTASGRPGQHWTARGRTGLGEVGSAARSESLLDVRVRAFDVEAVEAAANGETIEPPVPAADQVMALIAERNAKAAK